MIVILFQNFRDFFSTAGNALGITINLQKITVMYQPAPDEAYPTLSIYVYIQKLKVVKKSVYWRWNLPPKPIMYSKAWMDVYVHSMEFRLRRNWSIHVILWSLTRATWKTRIDFSKSVADVYWVSDRKYGWLTLISSIEVSLPV